MELEYDVLVIGAGPAGSCAARYAAESGCDTLMIEKRPEIGTPVRCGEGMAKDWITEIGLEPSGKWLANEIDGARIISPDGSTLEVDEKHAGNECGYNIERDLFDRELAERAARAGSEIMVKTGAYDLIKEDGKIVGARLEHMGKHIDVRAKVVIGADGFESQVGRWGGLKTWIPPKDVDACLQYTMVNIEGNHKLNDFYVGSCSPGGYIWVFWKGPDIANVGIGCNLSKIWKMAETKTYLDKFIQKHSEFRKGEVIEEVAGAVSVSRPVEKSVASGLMLVGDAARMIDPLTGGGILNGCIAGRMAGEVAGQALQAGDFSENFLMRYEKLWRDRMENHLYRNWMVKERLLNISDDTLNKCVRAVAEEKLTKMTTLGILKAIEKRYPELVKEFQSFL